MSTLRLSKAIFFKTKHCNNVRRSAKCPSADLLPDVGRGAQGFEPRQALPTAHRGRQLRHALRHVVLAAAAGEASEASGAQRTPGRERARGGHGELLQCTIPHHTFQKTPIIENLTKKDRGGLLNVEKGREGDFVLF